MVVDVKDPLQTVLQKRVETSHYVMNTLTETGE